MSERKASQGAMEELHNALATKLTELLENVDGEVKGAASILNVARQFLKDNGIDTPGGSGTPIGNLGKKVSEFPFDPAEDSRPN